jgi:hypothetical protein
MKPRLPPARLLQQNRLKAELGCFSQFILAEAFETLYSPIEQVCLRSIIAGGAGAAAKKAVGNA